MFEPEPHSRGPIAVPIQTLAGMLARCDEFQERAGLSAPDPDAVEKLLYGARGGEQRIWYPSLEDEAFPSRMPFAVVSPTETWALTKRAGGGRNYHPYPTGVLEVLLADRDRYPGKLAESFRDFTNFVGVLARQLADQSADDENPVLEGLGKLALEDIRQAGNILACDETEQAARGYLFWFVVLEVEYGV